MKLLQCAHQCGVLSVVTTNWWPLCAMTSFGSPLGIRDPLEAASLDRDHGARAPMSLHPTTRAHAACEFSSVFQVTAVLVERVLHAAGPDDGDAVLVHGRAVRGGG